MLEDIKIVGQQLHKSFPNHWVQISDRDFIRLVRDQNRWMFLGRLTKVSSFVTDRMSIPIYEDCIGGIINWSYANFHASHQECTYVRIDDRWVAVNRNYQLGSIEMFATSQEDFDLIYLTYEMMKK